MQAVQPQQEQTNEESQEKNQQVTVVQGESKEAPPSEQPQQEKSSEQNVFKFPERSNLQVPVASQSSDNKTIEQEKSPKLKLPPSIVDNPATSSVATGNKKSPGSPEAPLNTPNAALLTPNVLLTPTPPQTSTPSKESSPQTQPQVNLMPAPLGNSHKRKMLASSEGGEKKMLKVDIPARKIPQTPTAVATPSGDNVDDDVFEAPSTVTSQKETPQQQVVLLGNPQRLISINAIQVQVPGSFGDGNSPQLGQLQTPNLKMATPSVYLNSQFIYRGFPQTSQESGQAERDQGNSLNKVPVTSSSSKVGHVSDKNIKIDEKVKIFLGKKA